MEEWCAGCGKTRDAGEYACGDCSFDVWLDYLPGALLSRRAPVDEGDPRAAVRGFMRGRVRLPPGTVAVLAGPEGIGKTTLALSMFAAPWLVSNEMGADQVTSYTARLGFSLAGFNAPVFYEAEEGEPAFFDVGPAEAADLVIDSISASPNERAVIRAAREYARREGARVIVVAHYTKDGKISGTTKIGHLFDHVIRMEWHHGARMVRVAKTRAGEGGAWPFTLDAAGVERPKVSGFYSVEGQRGAYQLKRHPANGASFADVLRTAEQDDELRARLPSPPLAVTARRSALYPGGWTEPDDRDARAAFAVSMGAKHWSPING